MLASMATQPKIQTHLQPSTFPSQSLLRKPLKTPIFSIKPKPSCFHLKSLCTLKTPARLKLSALKAQQTLPEEEKENETSTEKEVILHTHTLPLNALFFMYDLATRNLIYLTYLFMPLFSCS